MFVFVHGVPETADLWNKLRGELAEDSVALALPGFGTPRPAGFGATKDDYVAWLIRQLEAMDRPVDLVGHDWGAGLTYRVASTRPDLLRSWTADIANVMHPQYVWHAYAQLWQTPDVGEASFVALHEASIDDRVRFYEGLQVPREDAVTMVEAADATMASCILDLYRSATPNPYASWGSSLHATRAPGLVLFPDSDPFGEEKKSREVAALLGAQHQVLEGLGHWWPVQAPRESAARLESFAASVA